MKNILLRSAALIATLFSISANAQSFDEADINRLMASYELGAYAEIQQLKYELISSENGFKALQGVPDHSHTKIFIDFGKQSQSESVEFIEKFAIASGFDSLDSWIRVNDRILGVANAALLTGWGMHSDDPRYNDPDYPDTLAYLKDRSISWAKRVVAIDEFALWCEKLCVDPSKADEDRAVLAPRYLEVVKTLLPKEQ